ncbi:protein TIC100 [Citrus sinensis]|nr:protein TIC100 [Citrus sinensis]
MPSKEENQQQESPNEDEEQEENSNESDSDSDSDSDSGEKRQRQRQQDDDEEILKNYVPVRYGEAPPPEMNTPEINVARFNRAMKSPRYQDLLDYEEDLEEDVDETEVCNERMFDFPKDPENWMEQDLKELWADAPLEMTKPGWDPAFADEEDWDVVKDMYKAGKVPPIAPFYLPYRQPYPVVPDDHVDIATPKAVIEELDRIEEFLTWVSYVFADGSSYEGTVWDDLAHGKGVYIAEQGLVRYEGEWLQNNMEGHGVVEVDIPDIEPVPGSKLEEEMRAEGKIFSRDFMSPEDKKWLEMDIEDSIQLAGDEYEIPFYERDEWITEFGKKPEKGRYRYAGQWKHGRMHGCGLYEINERPIYGRFYFGELLEDSEGCDEETVALHAGLAEVAAAKARMFVNKPDGMVREESGPYSDPQHPYFYEEEDVPDYWKTYVHEIDREREIWLNSFYKSPLRIPMPAELEHWWEKEEPPEYIFVNKEPEPDPEDPSKLIYTEDPLILHTPTGRLINYIEDEEHGVRLFWQPPLKEGQEPDPEKIEFLPLGFDEFYGRVVEEKETTWTRIAKGVENKLKPMMDKLGKWTEEKKKESEMKLQLYEKELDLIEAELCLEEAIEEMDEELKKREEEEEKKAELGLEEEENLSALSSQPEKATAEVGRDEVKVEEGEEEEEEEEEEDAPASFGSVSADENQTKDDQKGKRPGDSPFSSSSLSFASCSLVSLIPSRLQQSFLSWKRGRLPLKQTTPCVGDWKDDLVHVDSVSFPLVLSEKRSLTAKMQTHRNFQTRNHANQRTSQLHSLSRILTRPSASVSPKQVLLKAARPHSESQLLVTPECEFDNILSLHTPMCYLESYTDTIGIEPHRIAL